MSSSSGVAREATPRRCTGAAAGLSVAVVEKDKVGGPACTGAASRRRSSSRPRACSATVEGAKEFGVHAGQPTVDFSVSQDRKDKVVEQLFRGLSGCYAPAQDHHRPRHGQLLPGKIVEVTGPDGAVSSLSGTNIVLASGSVPRTLAGFDPDGRYVLTSDELLDLRVTAALGRGHRRRCHRLRVRLDAVRPRRHVTLARGAPEAPPWL